MSEGNVVDGERFEIVDETGRRHTVVARRQAGRGRYGSFEGSGMVDASTVEYFTLDERIVWPGSTPDDFTIPDMNLKATRVR